jgi:hypothetical protein
MGRMLLLRYHTKPFVCLFGVFWHFIAHEVDRIITRRVMRPPKTKIFASHKQIIALKILP